MLQDHQDAFGHAMWDYHRGREACEIVERDDGFFSTSGGPAVYLAPYEEWSEVEKEGIRYAAGRVLDVGCGAGRHALYLQDQGLEVIGIDASPGAVQLCRARGVRDVHMLALTQLSRRLGQFDTVLMLGNNFSLVGHPRRARWWLRRLRQLTTARGRIVAQTIDPYRTDLPEHVEYHARNRKQGKLSGQARIRVRYKRYVTPWIDFLLVSPQELITLIQGTGWEVARLIDLQEPHYVAVLEKAGER